MAAGMVEPHPLLMKPLLKIRLNLNIYHYLAACLSLVLASSALFLSGCGGGEGGGPPESFAVNVVVAPVERQKVIKVIDLVGSLTANERVEIKSEISGMISKIHFEEGNTVREGRLLVALDDQKLSARLAEAKANFTLARTNRVRNKSLLESKTISEQTYDQSIGDFDVAAATLELRKRELKDARIVAPFDGVVGYRQVSPGQFMQVGQTMTVLVNMNPIKADFDVPERFIGQLQTGQRIDITVAAYAQSTFTGEVYFISPEVEVTTRNVLVRAFIDNESGLLKPGMFGNLKLVLQEKEDALVIPESALIMRVDKSIVMVVDDDNIAQMREVQAGIRMEGTLEILEGLSAGERVIVEGHQKVGPGTPVNPRPNNAGNEAS